MNPLNNHRQSLVLGIVIALIIAVLIAGWPLAVSGPSLARWFHIVSGVFWIGLLYYFNVAQTPALADAAADKGGPGGAGITKYVAPRALFWFRWAALATWIGGAWLLGANFVAAFTFQTGFVVIGIGAMARHHHAAECMGRDLAESKKKILGLKPATDEEKARARKTAGMASRVNFVLSIPMLMCMAGQSHGLLFFHSVS